jgi:putative FmdB family regulatory protein
MPIYKFHCGNCERDSEVLVRSSRWKGSKCPHCGSTKLSKKLSVFASAGASGGAAEAPPCEGGTGSCGCCGGGGKHRH